MGLVCVIQKFVNITMPFFKYNYNVFLRFLGSSPTIHCKSMKNINYLKHNLCLKSLDSFILNEITCSNVCTVDGSLGLRVIHRRQFEEYSHNLFYISPATRFIL